MHTISQFITLPVENLGTEISDTPQVNDAWAGDMMSSKHARSYLTLRRSIGWIGMILPLILALGNALVFHENPLCHSISRYYHTGMRDVFVGGLCAMALFMFCYSGQDQWEKRAGHVAGVCILGVSFFPVAQPGSPWGVIGTLHYVFAFGLFVTLAVFSLFLFSRTRNPDQEEERRKTVIHIVCGLVVVGCILGILVHSAEPACDTSRCSFVLVAEEVALTAFGLSWLVETRESVAGAKNGWAEAA